MIKIYVLTSDMTSRSYFGKMNSTLGSIVPLAMFDNSFDQSKSMVMLVRSFLKVIMLMIHDLTEDGNRQHLN